MSRLRVRFTKLGKVRFTSHRDLARVFERSLRKAGLPVAYSEGFTPRPKVSFGLALPTGAESLAEYLDVEVLGDHDPDEVAAQLNASLAPGFTVSQIVVVDRSAPSLQEDVVACDWEITLAGVTLAAAEETARQLLGADQLLLRRSRKGEERVDDVRPAIEFLDVLAGERPRLHARLATRGRGLRPAELVEVGFPDRDPLDVTAGLLRTNQWIERDGARWELVPPADAVAPTPNARAIGG